MLLGDASLKILLVPVCAGIYIAFFFLSNKATGHVLLAESFALVPTASDHQLTVTSPEAVEILIS